MQKLKYPDKQIKRLDHYLNEVLGDISRSQIQKLIKSGQIKVNQEIKSPNYKLKQDDVIEIVSTDAPAASSTKEPRRPVPQKYEVVDDTDDYLVINKPAGIAVHQSGGEITSLIDLVLKDYPDIAKVGEDPVRPGIVHRLDKDVSGLIVIAKTQEAFFDLKRQFQLRKVKKSYQALVHGSIDKAEDEINFPIARSSSGHKMAALPLSGEASELGKNAITKFVNLKEYINYCLLRVYTKTGRTHQIRAHMAAYGHPLVGDDLYGTKKTREMNKRLQMDRVFLVADQLSFTDLSGEKKSYEIKIGDNLNELLNQVK